VTNARSASVTPAAVKSKLADIEADTTLDETVKTTATDLYRKAQEALQAAAQNAQRADKYREVITNGSQRLEALRQELAVKDDPSAPEQAVEEDISVAKLEPRLLQAQAELAALRKTLGDLEKTIAEETARPEAARTELGTAQATLEKIEQEKKQPRPENESPVLQEARVTLLNARQIRREAEIDMLQQESLSRELRLELLRLERDRSQRLLAKAENAAQLLSTQLNNQRQKEAAEAKAQAERAEREAAAKHPLLGEAAATNADITREMQRVTAEIERQTNEKNRIAERTAKLQKDADATRKRVELAGISETLGRFLRDQRNRLFDTKIHERDSDRRQRLVADISLQQLKISEQLRGLENLDQAVHQAFIAQADGSLVGEQRTSISDELRELLQQRRSILERLSAAYLTQLRWLSEVDFEERQLALTSAEYARFLDERLLWVPSAQTLGLQTFKDLPGAVAWLLSPKLWLGTAESLLARAQRSWLWAFFTVVVPIVLLVVRSRLHRRLEFLNNAIGRAQSDRFIHTLEALALTFLLSVTGPLLLGLIGWRLESAVFVSDAHRAIGAGALDAAMFLTATVFLYMLCHPQGVGAVHFRWSSLLLRSIRRHWVWWMAATAPTIFVSSVFDWQDSVAYHDSLGRFAFMAQAIMLSVLLYFLLHPKSGLPARHLLQYRGGWIARLRHIWFIAAVTAPIALAVAAAAGFFYTALRLENRLVISAGVVLGAIIIYHVCLRGLYVTSRQLELQKARARRRGDAKTQGAPGVTTDSGIAVAVDVPMIDIASLNQQTHHLLKVMVNAMVLLGLWLVWADVLPALTVLSEIELWRYSSQLDGETISIPFTLQSVLLLGFITFLVVIAAKNLPAVLEIAVLQRLPLEAGLRYAITTMAQYTIVATGLVFVFDTLGVAWSNIQWLIAALSVGLGFGLQEIVANFVSGLIILFERPIRIGDAVTVGDTTGTVTKIRIRATTMLDWDNKEIIVPNKTFITERLVNWTLTDAVTRVVIPIGIAYGSDVDKAKEIITEVVRPNPLVLSQPPMQLFFLALGDSSLNFELRFYVRTLAERLQATDQLLNAIYQALRENGIEIPFPQRDINIKGIERLEAAVTGPAESPHGEATITLLPRAAPGAESD
jgi:potassium efflux system protein